MTLLYFFLVLFSVYFIFPVHSIYFAYRPNADCVLPKPVFLFPSLALLPLSARRSSPYYYVDISPFHQMPACSSALLIGTKTVCRRALAVCIAAYCCYCTTVATLRCPTAWPRMHRQWYAINRPFSMLFVVKVKVVDRCFLRYDARCRKGRASLAKDYSRCIRKRREFAQSPAMCW